MPQPARGEIHTPPPMIRYSRAELRGRLTGPTVPAVPEPLTGPHLDELWAELRAEAARGADTATPSWSQARSFAELGDPAPYYRAYFARRGRLNALAAVAWLDGDDRSLGALADMVWSVCEEYTWAVHAHEYLLDGMDRSMEQCVDLFACETAQALAEIVTLFGDRLPAAVTDRIRAQVRHRVLTPLMESGRPWSWESYTNNWAAVCSGGVGMTALALVEDLDELAAILDRCLASVEVYLGGLAADGCSEGVGYWVYGFGYFTYFAEALRERTGLDLLREVPLAAAMASFPAAVSIGGGRFVPFSDGSDRTALATGMLSRLRERLGTAIPGEVRVARFGEDHCHRWAHLARTLAWTDPAVLDRPTPDGGSWLPEPSWLVDRRTVNGVQVAFAAKGGHNDESHNHNDLGHFTVSAGGEQLLTDLGAGEYTATYFGPDRYTAHLHPSAEAHSVPIVDGLVQQPGRAAAAAVVRAHTGADGAELVLDLSAAYAGRPVVRSFTWQADATLLLTDAFGEAACVEELFVSRLEPRLGPGTVSWAGVHAIATLTYDRSVWKAETERITTTDHHGRPDTLHRLRLTAGPTVTAAFRLAVRQE